MPGIQEDEMLFALPWLKHQPALYHWGSVPVMLMDYIGALKTWLYWPIFSVWAPGVWSVRLPVCVVSVITVWLFFDLVERVAGKTAAICAAAMLATDAPFILTNVFDWGPVCLLLLSTVTSMNLLTRYAVSRNRVQLAGAFLIVGLATWYKSFFIVLFVAMACSWLIVYGFKQAGVLRVGIPVLLLGAVPLIAFNVQHSFATVKASSYLPYVAPDEKLLMMRRTLEGRSLENYMFSSSPHERIRLTGASAGDLAKSWFRDTNFYPGSLLFPVLILSLLALPFLRSSPFFKPLSFTWLAAAIAFGAMLMFRDAGAGPHHTVLIEPAPQFIVAVTGVALGHRFRYFVTLAIVLSNLWLLVQYAEAGRNYGFSVFWTDGVTNLARTLEADHSPVAFLEWGIENGIRTTSSNRVPVVEALPLRRGVVYVAHCDPYSLDPTKVSKFSGAPRVIADRHLNPVFCTYTLEK